MKLQPFVRKLESTSVFKQFEKKYPNAYIVAGFFIIDLESGNNVHQIDYYLPNEHKVAAFTLEPEVTMQVLELINEKKMEKLDLSMNVDLDALQGILDDEMKNRGFSEDIRKIIAILHKVDGKKIWELNCVLSGMNILRSHVDDESQTVLKMEKASMLDYVKRLPPGMLPGKGESTSLQTGGQRTSKDPEIQIKKLEQLEQAIEKEKEKLKEAVKSSEKSRKNSKQSKK